MSLATTTVVRRYRFPRLPVEIMARISEGRSESAKVWEYCRDLHAKARKERTAWPRKRDLQIATKSKFALHSQSAQMVCHAFLANVDTTAKLRKAGNLKMRYPWRDKSCYPLFWPEQAASVTRIPTTLGRVPPGTGHLVATNQKPIGFSRLGVSL